MEPATMPECISATPHVVNGMADPDHEIELVTDNLKYKVLGAVY